MVITLITLAIIVFEIIIYFGYFLDHLFGTYFSDRRISVEIANEDLKKNLPDMISFFDALNSVICFEVAILLIIDIAPSEFVLASFVYIASGIMLFITARKDIKYNIKEVLKVIIRTISLQVVFGICC